MTIHQNKFLYFGFRGWSSICNFGFRGEPRRMLTIIQRFGKYCSCYLQGECVVVANQPTKKLTKGGVLRKGQTSSLARFDHSCVQNALLEMVKGASKL
jgi:hypothetical protein